MPAKKFFIWPEVRKSKSMDSGLLITIAVFLLISSAACGQAAAKPTATAAPTATPAATLQPGDSTRTLTVDGLERTYILHIPPGIDNQNPTPLVLAFHEFLENSYVMQQHTGFNDTADQSGFILAYLDGTGTNHNYAWNAGGCCGPAFTKNIDDIAFVRQMLADLGTIFRIDPKRIYAVGFSNGGMFSYRLACEMSDTFAAIAAVSGPLFFSPCQPQQPVSVVHVNGLADRQVPYTGDVGTPPFYGIFFPTVEQGIANWVQSDGCSGAAKVEKKGFVTHTAYDSCRAGSAVELYTIDGGAHAWPNPYAFPNASNQMIWDFFKAHPKP